MHTAFQSNQSELITACGSGTETRIRKTAEKVFDERHTVCMRGANSGKIDISFDPFERYNDDRHMVLVVLPNKWALINYHIGEFENLAKVNLIEVFVLEVV